MIYLVIFIIGLAIGSFLNVLIDRLPEEESITGRSHCDYCKKTLEWVDLVPVFSFLFLRARCRRCKKKLSYFYPLVEIFTGISFILVFYYALGTLPVPAGTGQGPEFNLTDSLLTIHTNFLYILALLGIVASSIVIFFADFKYQIIPDSIQIALFGFSFLLLFTLGITPGIFLAHVGGAFATMLPILLLFAFTRGNGMGFGDVKLAFTMGFLLGTARGLTAVYLGFISGALIGIVLILLNRKNLKSKIAFGPFLIIGFATMIFFGNLVDEIIRSFYTF